MECLKSYVAEIVLKESSIIAPSCTTNATIWQHVFVLLWLIVLKLRVILNLNFIKYEIYYDSSFIIIENSGEVRKMNVTSRGRKLLIPQWLEKETVQANFSFVNFSLEYFHWKLIILSVLLEDIAIKIRPYWRLVFWPNYRPKQVFRPKSSVWNWAEKAISV